MPAHLHVRTPIHAVFLPILGVLAILLPGCVSHYRTPGGPAPIGAMTSPSIAEKFKAAPESPIPATLALVRVQEGGYWSHSVSGIRRGGVSIVSADDLELPEDVQDLATWPDVRAFTRLSAILVPNVADPDDAAASMLALREGAASLHADVVALYTIDTTFRVDDFSPGALGLLTLGLAPTKSAVVNSTASMAFIDVRTGFVYGTAEASARDDQAANSWTSDDAVDQCRRRVEREALVTLLGEARKCWTGIAAARRTDVARATVPPSAPLPSSPFTAIQPEVP